METTTNAHSENSHATSSNVNGNAQHEDINREYQMEKKLVSRLRDGIDMRGRYKYQLADVSVGYAAGKALSEPIAREAIGKIFEREMGVSLQGYLEQHRLDRGLEIGKERNGGGNGR